MTVFIECYADEAFVQNVLDIKAKAIKHAHGKGNVCNRLSRSTGAVGIVDEDPYSGKNPYEKEMLKNVVEENEFMILCKKKDANNKLIIIRPNLEKFLLNLAQLNKVNMSYYGLPNDYKNLHDELNFRRVNDYEPFLRFLTDLTLKDKIILTTIQKFFQST